MAKIEIGTVELAVTGINKKGDKEILKGDVTLADGSKAFISVYRAMESTQAPSPVKHLVKGRPVPRPPTSPVAPGAAFSSEQMAALKALLSTVTAPPAPAVTPSKEAKK